MDGTVCNISALVPGIKPVLDSGLNGVAGVGVQHPVLGNKHRLHPGKSAPGDCESLLPFFSAVLFAFFARPSKRKYSFEDLL